MNKNNELQMGFDFETGKVETLEEIKKREEEERLAALRAAEELKKAKSRLKTKLTELAEFDFSKLESNQLDSDFNSQEEDETEAPQDNDDFDEEIDESEEIEDDTEE